MSGGETLYLFIWLLQLEIIGITEVNHLPDSIWEFDSHTYTHIFIDVWVESEKKKQ